MVRLLQLQAENEKLKKENDELKNGFFQEHYKTQESQELMSIRNAWRKSQLDYITLNAEWEGKYKTAKADAYKEFDEASEAIIDIYLSKYSIKDFEEFKAICQILRSVKNEINNFLKELIGEDNA